MIGAEVPMLDDWIEARLKAHVAFDALYAGLTTRVHNMFAPNGLNTYPFIIFQCQDPPRDVRGVGVTRVMVDTLYVVKAVAQSTSYDPLKAVVSEIDKVMTTSTGSAAGTDGLVFTSIREEGFHLTEIDSGQQYRHLGGMYRIQAQAA